MKPWKTKARQTVLDQRPWLLVENHTVELPDSRLIPDWPWIITPDYVIVVAVTTEERFICFRQVKYGVEGTTLGIVGGFVEEGEEPIKAAQRELLEETGFVSDEWVQLGSYVVDANRHVGVGAFFLAKNAWQIAQPDHDDVLDNGRLDQNRAGDIRNRPDRRNVREQIAFIRGVHSCPGAPLARTEGRISVNRILDRMTDFRLSEEHHGPPDARRYSYEPTFIMRGLAELHLEFKPVP